MEIAAATAKEESRSLRSILNPKLSVPSFFDSVWQKSCATFSAQLARKQAEAEEKPLASWEQESVEENPHGELIHQGWQVLVHLLERAREKSQPGTSASYGDDEYILFKNQSSLSIEERALYGNSLFAAFLDGCSVVVNHADHYSPWIAALCQDLQLSFPHAYANCYLTPAGCQAVPPHADDRDVLILQVVGSKEWKVYENIPVPFPYPTEQVGKAGLEVPLQILQGPLLIEQTLHPGDVLYMPRGYVHQAQASSSQPSFHVTIALATHDWTLAGLVPGASQKILTSVVDYRKALPRHHGMKPWEQVDAAEQLVLQQQLDSAFQLLQREITAERIHNSMQSKCQQHNARAAVVRTRLLQEANSMPPSAVGATKVVESSPIVGKEAAASVTLVTRIRAATPEEKASVPPTKEPRGLHVRQDIYNGIFSILQRLKGDMTLQCPVKDLGLLSSTVASSNDTTLTDDLICDLTLLCFARQCVSLGALAIAQS
jgi:hypothetical protein